MSHEPIHNAHADKPSPGGSRVKAAGPAASAPPLRYGSERDVHLLDRLTVLYRYRRAALSVFILTMAVVMLPSHSSVPIYQAQARLLIEDQRSTAIPGLNADTTFYQNPEPYYQTQYRILKGRDLTRHVVRKVRFDTVREFSPRAAPEPARFGRVVKDRLFGWMTRNRGVQPEPPAFDESADESALVSAFLARVGVEPVRGSHLVDLTFRSTDPAFAAQAANTLVEEYIDQNLALKLQAAQNMLEWLGTELATQQKKVEESERALAEYRDKEDALSLDDRQNIVIARLNQLNEAVTHAKTVQVQKEALYNQVKSASGTPDAIPVIAQNLQVQSLKTKLAELQRQKAELSERYGDRHPQMQNINASLQDVQRQLDLETAKALQAVRNEYETGLLEERTLTQNLERAKSDASDLNRKSIDYSIMEREARSNRQVYEALLQREKELRVSSNSRANNVRLVDRAEVPKTPLLPSGHRSWLISLVVGLIMAVAVAFGLDYLNDTIKTPDDVARHLKLPLLGLVPSVKGDDRRLPLTTKLRPEFAEAFRLVRTSLVFSSGGDGTRVVVVTSAQPFEGKTTTACNLAMALASGGAQVLLIDADLRRPSVHRALGLKNERGLSDLLASQAPITDVVQRLVEPNLWVMTAGRTPPNPAELLGSVCMNNLMTSARNSQFDWVIIDTPPVSGLTDALVLSSWASSVTFVIGSEMTRRRLAERSIETLMTSKTRILGVILNRVDVTGNRYYYSRYYGKNYYRNYSAAAGRRRSQVVGGSLLG